MFASLPAQHFEVTVIAGHDISPKGPSTKVDAYYTVGAVDSTEEWVKKPAKSKHAKATTEPAWFSGVHSFDFLDVESARSVKIEIWDKGLIGKGDLLASAVIPFASLTQSKVPVNDEWTLQYANGTKSTTEMTPTVSVQYIFWTRDWKSEADKKSVALLKVAEQLVMSNADTVDVPIEKVRSVAQKFVEVAQGKTSITEKSQLSQLAQATGLTATFSFFDANSKLADAPAGRLSIRSGGSAFVDYLWDVLDTNKDGQIDFQELLMGIAMHTAASPAERAEFYFDIFDTDKSGCLSREEVVKLWQKSLQDPELKNSDSIDWNTADKVFNDVINDFNRLNLALQLTDAVFSHVDKDGSGTITKSEYMDFCSDEGVRSSLSAMAQRALEAASVQIDSAARRRLLRHSVSLRM